MVSEAVLERVERGASWLDAKRPDWLDAIDLEILCMSNCKECVVGQVFGDYCGVREEQNWGEADAEALGFWAPFYDPDPLAVYEQLAAAWRSLILARRAVAKAALRGIAEAVTQREEALV